MRHHSKKIVASFLALLLVAAALGAVVPLRPGPAAGDDITAIQGIGIGGSVANSTINNTVNQENPATLAMLAKALSDKDISEEHRREAEAKAAELATKLGFTKAAVTEFFKTLGETDVPEEKIPARLVQIASHFAQTRDELAALAPDDPLGAELVRSAKSAVDAGRLAEADTLLDQAKEAELAALRQAHELKQKAQEAQDRHALNAAKLTAGRGNIALTQLRYADAADRFNEAAAFVPAGHPDAQANYLRRQADALHRQGDEKGENEALKQSIAAYDEALKEFTRERVPFDWAGTQNNRGNALKSLGERESGTARLEQAVAAYDEALKEYTRERAPLQWASSQHGLATTLAALAERRKSAKTMEQALTCMRGAAEVYQESNNAYWLPIANPASPRWKLSW